MSVIVIGISFVSRPANRLLALMMVPHTKRVSVSALKKSTATSTVGAPAQHNQSSRKGKKAWRKNVDIEDLEDKLESLREEERTLGCAFILSPPSALVLIYDSSTLQQRTDSELFVVDTKGDDKGTGLFAFSHVPTS